VGLTTAAYI